MRKQGLLLGSLISTVIIAILLFIIWQFYQVALKQTGDQLSAQAKSQKYLIEAIARFDVTYSSDDIKEGATAATLSQVIDAHNRYSGEFGETGEFVMASRVGDNLVFLRQRLGKTLTVPFDNKAAESMRLALRGRSGVVTTIDYRGETVLAAFEPVNFRDQRFGIVAKIDLREIQSSFINLALIGTLSLLALLMVPLTIFFRIPPSAEHKQKQEVEISWFSGWKNPAVIGVIVFGVTLSVVATQIARDYVSAEQLNGFEKKFDEKLIAIQQEIERNLSLIERLNVLYATSKNISRSEFSRFIDSEFKLEKDQNTLKFRALEWIPRVAHQERSQYEVAAQKDGMTDFSINERVNGDIVRANDRKEYFPVYFIEPLKGNEKALGFDLASEPQRLAALEGARDSGQLTITDPLHLVQEAGENRTYLAFSPVYQGEPISVEARRRALKGFIVGVFHVDNIVNSAIDSVIGADDIALKIYDKGPGGKELLFTSNNSYVDNPAQNIDRNTEKHHTIKNLIFANRFWVAEAIPTQNYKESLNSNVVVAVFLLGLLLTYLVALQFRNTAMRTAAVESLVVIKTAALKESEERFSSFMKNLPVISYIANSDNEFEYVNESWLNFFDFKNAEDVVGKRIFDVLPESIAQRFTQQNQQVLASGKPVIIESTLEDGKTHLLAHKFIIRRDNLPSLIGGNVVDISTQKEAVKDLLQLNQELEQRVGERTKEVQASQKRLQAIVEDAVDGLIVIDELGAIEEFSPAAQRIFGYAKEELAGKNINIIVPSPHHNLHDQYLHNYLETGIKRIIGGDREVEGLRKDGSLFPLDLAVSVTEIEGKKIFIGSVRDITARKQAELELVNALNAAEAANRSKSVFLAAMSHEIRTPMNGVIGVIDLLWDGELTPIQRHLIKISRESALALLRIIDDILDFSKIEAGKMMLECAEVSIRDVIEGVASTLQPSAEKQNVRLDIFIDPAISEYVLGDQVRIRQILFNLGGNAIKFSGGEFEKQGSVYIRAERLADSGTEHADAIEKQSEENICFRVIDNGIGMAEDMISNLFNPFTQAEQSTTRRFGGTGLGLTITKKLVDLMEGNITVRSKPDHGSCFIVTLPLRKTDNTDYSVTEPDISNLNIVAAVSDHKSKADINVYLKTAGAKVTFVDNLDDARNTALNTTNTIMLIGSEHQKFKSDPLIEQLRNDDSCPGICFVMLSATPSEKTGMILPDMYRAADHPLSRSLLMYGISAVADGISPDIREHRANWRAIEESIEKNLLTEEVAGNDTLLLYVEDNETNRKITGLQLNKLGYKVEMACDGREGFDKWRSGKYGLILSDCHMPEIDGFEMTAMIRAEEEQQNLEQITIIAVTANALVGEANRCIKAGMDDYLSKPVELSQLNKMMTKWLPHKTTSRIRSLSDDVVATIQTDNEIEQEKNPDPIDASVLPRLVGGDKEMHQRLLEGYIKTSIGTFTQLEEAYQDQDMDVLGELGHKLKSASRQVGATELGNLCEQLEESGQSENWQAIENLVPKITEQWKLVRDFVGNQVF